MAKGNDARLVPLLAFWLLGILWGSSFIYMKAAADYITPVQIVFLRVLFGLIPLAVYAYVTGAFDRGHVRHARHFLVMAVVGTIAYYYGFAKGTSLLLSGVSGALSGLTPIVSFLLAFLLVREERITLFKAGGIAVGFFGVLTIARPFGADLSATNLEGVIYNLIGSIGVGASVVYARKYIVPLNIPVAATLTYQLGLSLLVLMVVTDFSGMLAITSSLPALIGLVLGLGLLGTGVAFILLYYIIDRLGAVSAASVAYVPPVIALAIGLFLVGEDIGAYDLAGAGLILTGVLLVNGTWGKPDTAAG